jgi:hypothetical protein
MSQGRMPLSQTENAKDSGHYHVSGMAARALKHFAKTEHEYRPETCDGMVQP